MWNSAIPESSGDKLLAKDRKALLEDVEHLYFTGVGILVCALSGWKAAVGAAIATVLVRDILRTFKRWRRYK